MIFGIDSIKLHKDSCSYTSISDDGLLALLKHTVRQLVDVPASSPPLPSFDVAVSSSSYISPPPSFESPFDDPSMEPLPLGPNTSNGNKPSSSESLFMMADDCPSSSFKECNKQLRVDTNLRQEPDANLRQILDPMIDFAGSKRSSDDLFTDHGPVRKRQRRTSPLQSDEESMARFRPYQEKQWREHFDKLVQYKRQNGHCCVPHSYPDDPILARWVKRQRYQYKKMNNRDPTSTMTTRRIEELQSIGFVWHSHASTWQEKLNELKAFKQQKGHCNVPSNYPENAALSTWVKCQRRQYKLYTSGSSSAMTVERLRVLESVGFVFEASRKAAATTRPRTKRRIRHGEIM